MTDCEKSNRFGKMLLLDVPDEKLLSLAAEIPTAPFSSRKSAAKQRIDITEPPEEAKEKPYAALEIIRKKVQAFEEVDIDRISEFVTMNTED